MKDNNDFDLRGKNASIQTKFNFGQRVWWIQDGTHITSGEIIGIKGQLHNYTSSKYCELQVRFSDSRVECDFWINENQLFESSNDIIQSLQSQLRKEKLNNI